MARRRMTVRRIDPWSVLKFGFVANLCLLAIGLICFGVVWYAIQRIGVIEQACDVARGVGFEECGIDGGNLFRWALLLGLLGTVIMTGLLVFFAFLHNLIADMVGGITVTLSEEGAAVRDTVTARTPATTATTATAPVPTVTGARRAPGAVPPLPPPPQPAPSLRTDARPTVRSDGPQPVGAPGALPPTWPWERDEATGPVPPRPGVPATARPAAPPPASPRPAAPAPPRPTPPTPPPPPARREPAPAPVGRPPAPAPAAPSRPPAPEHRPAAPARAVQRTDETLFGPRPGQDE